ncbi:DUF1178 family protein [Candidatus Pelagibacter sp.]|uniref:DUF1178 family protein n=1 Tax=Candidatus Pelagibacter sp. TaxID=2024849 RepID=UPI003F8250C5
MIKYQLNCQKCKIEFDSWFASSKEYERLKNKNLLCCIECGSNSVEKSLMAPNLSSKKNKLDIQENKKILEIKNKLKEYKKFVEKNLDYVGDNFAYEARSIHYGGKKRKKGIYGKASQDDIKDLSEEGIETQALPWFEDKEN